MNRDTVGGGRGKVRGMGQVVLPVAGSAVGVRGVVEGEEPGDVRVSRLRASVYQHGAKARL